MIGDKKMNRNKISSFSHIIALLVIVSAVCFILLSGTVFASTSAKTPNGKNYESHSQDADNLDYDSAAYGSVNTFAYGKTSLGKLQAVGGISTESTLNGYKAYGTEDTISLTYSYDGSNQSGNKNEWNITSDGTKMFNGAKLSKKVGEGTIVVQKSYDMNTWQEALVLNDVFHKNTESITSFYTLDDSDVLKGCYYRVTILYEMRKQTGESGWGIFKSAVYDYDKCMEIYEFYACYDENPVVLRDVMDGSDVSSLASVEKGFVVDTCGSSDTVTVRKVNSASTIVVNQESVCAAGNYIVEVKNALGTTFQYNIKITDGLDFAAMSPVVFENGKKDDYAETNQLNGNTSMGIPAHTSLKIAQKYGTGISKDNSGKFPGYGITGQNVYLFMELINEDTLRQNGWEIVSDDWGKKEKETIAGAVTGEMATGTIVVQTSTDGVNWQDADKGRYAEGLYTTDYEANYGDRGDVLVYTPDGNAVLNGLYIRVYYAYKVYQKETKTYCRELERYCFYLCNDELGAVTLHNLSLEGEVENLVGDDDETTLDIYKHAETMNSGAGTVTGFQVDTSLNPTVTYTIKRDGQAIAVASDHKYTTTGKYEITLTSAVGKVESRIIYVDRDTADGSLHTYFGDNFIQGKRIYSEDCDYPVYEGGETKYNLAKVSDSYLAISGTIENITTGEKTEISSSRSARSGQIDDAGDYVAVFTTNPNFDENNMSGDARTFTFNFRIIANGTAPGPIVNERELSTFDTLNVSDSYPIYYGLTYQSASKGYITLAFKTREDAVTYAYNYEKGMVEKQSDGTFRYNGSFHVAQKEEYNSAWDLTDAMNYFAEEAVQRYYFDLTDEFTYLTLSDDLLESTSNLRTLELDKSVIIFADGQKALLTDKQSLPIINDKVYRYLTPGAAGTVRSGEQDFEFVSDKYGCDSYSVTITDCNGGQHSIDYKQSVEKQLAEADCPTGIVTVTEKTIYGDENKYEAVYINEGDPTTSLEIVYYEGKDKKSVSVSADSSWNESVVVDTFSIAAINDELDPYALVIVSNGKNQYFYAADQTTKDAWSEPGEYNVHVVNRMGYGYDFKIIVQESEYVTIMFDGYGTEDTQAIVARYGEVNLKLPTVDRYGYEFVGFEDSSGNRYTDTIENVNFKDSMVLTAVWQSKQYTLTLQNGDESEELSLGYGEECELPVPKAPEGLKFDGWMLDGELISDNIFKLEEEQNKVLIASFSEMEASDDGDISVNDGAEKKKTNKWPILILLIAGVIVVFVYKRKKGQVKEQENLLVDRETNPVSDETGNNTVLIGNDVEVAGENSNKEDSGNEKDVE